MTDHTAIQETDEMKAQWAKHIKQGASMNKIDLIIDALELAIETSEFERVNSAYRQALAAARELKALAQKQTKCPRCGEANPAEIHTCSPQVAQPEREWVGLTGEEVDAIRKDIFEKYKNALVVTRDVTNENNYSAFNFYQAIEKKLRSKND